MGAQPIERGDLVAGMAVEVQFDDGHVAPWPARVVDPLYRPDAVLVGELVGHDTERWWLTATPPRYLVPVGTARARAVAKAIEAAPHAYEAGKAGEDMPPAGGHNGHLVVTAYEAGVSDWEPTEPLDRCVCGKCLGCPDGYHHKPDELPCGCTPDCVEMCDRCMTGVDECSCDEDGDDQDWAADDPVVEAIVAGIWGGEAR